ncbi:hypothetical protein J7I97_16925 [Streptomyces sp. ISL-87]|nr:hypothetical protein [Streptomyces sp. ISL-87]MBT2609911.1 hypothetical protein [Streptomyces sp. ISL-87]
MTVTLALSPTRLIDPPKDVEELVIIENVQDYTASMAPACNDDNPYT